MKWLFTIFGMIGLISIGGHNCFAQSNSYEGVKFSFELIDAKSKISKNCFAGVDEILIRTKLENNSFEPFPFPAMHEYYLYKFRLTKSDEILPIAYRSDKAEIISAREEDLGAGSRLLVDPILPGDPQELNVLILGERYENLHQGSYLLSIEYKTFKSIEINGKPQMLRLRDEVKFNIGCFKNAHLWDN